MKEKEGVIKYQLDYTETPPVAAERIREINAWRQILFLLGLIGQDPDRYGGYGFGNVSCRLNPDENIFLISGTQTAHLPMLGVEDYTVVTLCDPMTNHIVAEGPVKPSSEALTHGAIYQVDSSINFVFHVHSPAIWQQAARLAIPITSPDALYGTPEMAKEIDALIASVDAHKKHIIAMGGHEDGMVSFGPTAELAGQTLITWFSQALQLQDQHKPNK
ncbi:class II aldolase/adducin family protein [Kaarinaea lacus]